jgi:hypothetical protein
MSSLAERLLEKALALAKEQFDELVVEQDESHMGKLIAHSVAQPHCLQNVFSKKCPIGKLCSMAKS